MVILILLTISIDIGLIRLLEVGLSNTKYGLEDRLYEGYISADWVDDSEIKVIAANDNKDDDKKDLREKTRQLKKDKRRLK